MISPWILSALLLLFGLWVTYGSRDLLLNGLRSYWWPKTKGKIIKAEDQSFFGPGLAGSAATEVVSVRYPETGYYYEYQVGLTRYTGDTYCFGVHIDKEPACYLIGDHVTVYHDPIDPKRAVLRRGVQLGTLFGPMVVAVGVGYSVWILFR